MTQEKDNQERRSKIAAACAEERSRQAAQLKAKQNQAPNAESRDTRRFIDKFLGDIPFCTCVVSPPDVSQQKVTLNSIIAKYSKVCGVEDGRTRMPVFKEEDDAEYLLHPIRQRARQLHRTYEGLTPPDQEGENEEGGLSDDEAAGLSEDESDLDEETRDVIRKANLSILGSLDEGCMGNPNDEKRGICVECRKSLDKGKVPRKALINGTWAGEVPDVLRPQSAEFPDGLTDIELSMISLYNSVTILTMLPSGNRIPLFFVLNFIS